MLSSIKTYEINILYLILMRFQQVIVAIELIKEYKMMLIYLF
jgi:hypothetical protein